VTDAGAGVDTTPQSRKAQLSALRATAAAGGETAGVGRRRPKKRWDTRVHQWARTIHVYTSMLALLAVLFFAGTGLLLNNPSWTLGTHGSVVTHKGTVPTAVIGTDGTIDYLAADRYFRSEYDVRGDVTDYGEAAGKASITYKNPGYSAYAYFDVSTRASTVTVTTTGLVSTLEDIHTGNNVGGTWKVAIDVIAVALIVIALAGLTMQFFLRRRRRSALVTAGLGLALFVGVVAWVIMA
jgi:hypothetical protein